MTCYKRLARTTWGEVRWESCEGKEGFCTLALVGPSENWLNSLNQTETLASAVLIFCPRQHEVGRESLPFGSSRFFQLCSAQPATFASVATDSCPGPTDRGSVKRFRSQAATQLAQRSSQHSLFSYSQNKPQQPTWLQQQVLLKLCWEPGWNLYLGYNLISFVFFSNNPPAYAPEAVLPAFLRVRTRALPLCTYFAMRPQLTCERAILHVGLSYSSTVPSAHLCLNKKIACTNWTYPVST